MAISEMGLVALVKELVRSTNPETVAEAEFTPFDLSYLRDLPKETDRPSAAGRRPVQRETADRPAVFPPAVPYN